MKDVGHNTVNISTVPDRHKPSIKLALSSSSLPLSSLISPGVKVQYIQQRGEKAYGPSHSVLGLTLVKRSLLCEVGGNNPSTFWVFVRTRDVVYLQMPSTLDYNNWYLCLSIRY